MKKGISCGISFALFMTAILLCIASTVGMVGVVVTVFNGYYLYALADFFGCLTGYLIVGVLMHISFEREGF